MTAKLPRNLEALEQLLVEREIAVMLLTNQLDAAVDFSWKLTDDEAYELITPYSERVWEAERGVASVKQLISDLTPSAWQRNGR